MSNRFGILRWAVRILMLTVLLAAAWYPFELDLGVARTNDLEVLPDGSLRFSGQGFAWTAEAPEWLGDAIEAGALTLELNARPATLAQGGPARLFTVSEDEYSRDLTVGQEGPDLVIRVRRAWASNNGVPPLVVPGAFADLEWHAIQVQVKNGALEVRIDEQLRLLAPLGPNALAAWDPSYRVALGNELTADRGWSGELRAATVSVGQTTVDYLDRRNTETPARYWRVERLRSFLLSRESGGIQAAVGHLTTYAIAGVVIALTARYPPRLLAICGFALALAALTEVSQAIFAARHAALLDFAVNALGALVGGAAVYVLWRTGVCIPPWAHLRPPGPVERGARP